MAQTPPPPASNTYALLIGVNDYSTFDRDKCHDLKGSSNDVLLLASYCMRVLGIPAANIRALTSPRLTDDFLQQRSTIPGISGLLPENLGEATEAEARAGLTRLLQDSRKGSALLAFSGHGTWSHAAGPQLCLTDTSSDFTRGVIPLADIDREVEEAYAKDRLIAVFDCCHVAASTARHGGIQAKALQQEGTADDVAKHEDRFDVSKRVILGAKPGKAAYQVLLGGDWHGALTFALTTAAERWRSTDEMSNGAYKHVLRRAKRTLKALGVRQKPALRSPEAEWAGIRRQPFMGVVEGPTVPKPDAEEDGVQLNPDFFYEIHAGSMLVAQIASTGTTPMHINGSTALLRPNTEYWYVNATGLASLVGASQITIKSTALSNPITLDPTVEFEFTSLEAATWSSTATAPGAGLNYVFRGTPTSPTSATAYLLLNIPASGTLSLTGVQWYLTNLPGPPSSLTGDLNPGSSGGITYTLASLPTSGYYEAPSR